MLPAHASMTDRCDIERRTKTGEDEAGSPTYDDEPVAEGVRCRFDDGSTAYVREDTGERVRKPATLHLPADTDILEADVIHIEDIDQAYRVTGIDRVRHPRRGRTELITCELERAD